MANGRNKKSTGFGGWVVFQLFNTSLPWLLGMFGAGIGFYFITTQTLQQHTADLVELKQQQRVSRKEDEAARERVRAEFLTESKATAAGIARLNETTAVMSATLLSVQKELEKVTTRLDAPSIRR